MSVRAPLARSARRLWVTTQRSLTRSTQRPANAATSLLFFFVFDSCVQSDAPSREASGKHFRSLVLYARPSCCGPRPRDRFPADKDVQCIQQDREHTSAYLLTAATLSIPAVLAMRYCCYPASYPALQQLLHKADGHPTPPQLIPANAAGLWRGSPWRRMLRPAPTMCPNS